MAGLMLLMFVAGVAGDAPLTLHAHMTSVPPRIDGTIEGVWAAGDSAQDFVQQTPRADSPATEITVAYVLYDRENLYVAFRCLVRDARTIRARLNSLSDAVSVRIDPFHDHINLYVKLPCAIIPPDA